MVKLARANGIFDLETNPKLAGLLRHELEANLGADYDFKASPRLIFGFFEAAPDGVEQKAPLELTSGFASEF